MEKFDYSRLRKVAVTQITRFGTDIVIESPAGSDPMQMDMDPDPWNPIRNQLPDSTQREAVAVFSPVSKKEIDGKLIQAGDTRIAVLPAANIRVGDRVWRKSMDSVKYRVNIIDSVNPADTELLVDCVCRRV